MTTTGNTILRQDLTLDMVSPKHVARTAYWLALGVRSFVHSMHQGELQDLEEKQREKIVRRYCADALRRVADGDLVIIDSSVDYMRLGEHYPHEAVSNMRKLAARAFRSVAFAMLQRGSDHE